MSKVYVCIITFNQIDYIIKSVESALMQKTAFDYSILIGDDFSTDGTREILLEYKEKYPDKIELNLLPSKGQGMPGHINFITSLRKCGGKYIAFLDGDDYWTDDKKLQMQVDFLEKNQKYVMCHHDASSEYIGGVKLKKKFNNSHPVSGFYEACQITFPFFSSVLVRRNVIKSFDFTFWLWDMPMGDFPLWSLITTKGDAYYIDKRMMHYRVNQEGVSAKFDYTIYLESRVLFFEKVLKSDLSVDKKFVHKILSRYYMISAGVDFSNRELKLFVSRFFLSIKNMISGFTFHRKKYSWIDRVKRSYIFKIFFANCVKAFKSN